MLSLFFLGLWVAMVVAGPVSPADVLEKLRGVPEGWRQLERPRSETVLPLRIAVRSADLPSFEEQLLDISTPGHSRYGQFLEREEMKALLRPTGHASEAVLQWLDVSGVPRSEIEDDGEWINFNVSIAKAERMLDTSFYWYENRVNGARRIRTLRYSVPHELHAHVDMVQPTTRFGQIRSQASHIFRIEPSTKVKGYSKSVSGSGASSLNVTACNDTITPACIREIYNVGDYKASANNGNKLGITGYLEQYAKYDQLTSFLKTYVPGSQGNFTFQSINGGLNDQSDTTHDDGEANLDIQYGVGIASPAPVTFYSTAGRGPLVADLDQPTQPGSNEPYLDFLNYILKLPNDELPHTLSTSYGEDEQAVPEAYNRQVCSMLGQLGSRGVSVIFSSGDSGPGSGCLSNDGTNKTVFNPTFPAGCPYVTSVGGTHFINPEQAVDFSSGGFSQRFDRPSYQDAAVSAYLEKIGDTFQGLYNPKGRGIPDVAAQGARFHIFDRGQDGLISGTSASAPTFSAIISLLNDARVSAKQQPLGFLNPFLYSNGLAGLNDITLGGSTGCTGTDMYTGQPSPYVPGAGWNATEGWDPVTGNGTPDFGKLLRILGLGKRRC